jgi:hypothetical protein
VIVVDVRSFLGGDGDIDRDDLRQMIFGPRHILVNYVHTRRRTGAPISGVFDLSNVSSACRTARERLHMIIAVHEQDFVDDEIRQTLVTFSNPYLTDWKDALPFRPSPTAIDYLRNHNPLWNLG